MPANSSPSSASSSRSCRSGAMRSSATRAVKAPQSVRLPPRRRQPALVDVERRGAADLLCKLSVGPCERLARVLHDGVDRARRERGAEELAHKLRVACAAGENNSQIARRLGVARPTVAKWRGRFAAARLEGLLDEPRPGRPLTLGDERIEEVIVRTLETAPPDGGTHWSTRRMATASGLSQSTVSRVWRAFGLQPHRVEHWKLSKDPLFVEKVRDIVGLYLDPPERALVLCCLLYTSDAADEE